MLEVGGQDGGAEYVMLGSWMMVMRLDSRVDESLEKLMESEEEEEEGWTARKAA